MHTDQKTNQETVKRDVVLVVDDEPGSQKNLVRILENLGYNTQTSEDSSNVTAIIQEHSEVLLAAFLDLSLSSSDISESLGILELIKHEIPDMPVFVYSGQAPEDASKMIERGAFWYIDKVTASDEQFEAAIQSALLTWKLVGKLGDVSAHRDFFQHLLDSIPYEVMARDEDYCVHYENHKKRERFGGPLQKGESDCRYRYEEGCDVRECICDYAFGKYNDEDQERDRERDRDSIHRKYHTWPGLKSKGIEGAELFITAARVLERDPAGRELVVETCRDVSCQVGFLELMRAVAALGTTNRVQVLQTVVDHFVGDHTPITRKNGALSQGEIGFTRARGYLVTPRGGFERIGLEASAGPHPAMSTAGSFGFDRETSPSIGRLWEDDDKVKIYPPEEFDEGVEQDTYRSIGHAEERVCIRILVRNHLDGVIFADKLGSKSPDGEPDERIYWEQTHWCKALAEYLAEVFTCIYQHEADHWLLDTEQALARAKSGEEMSRMLPKLVEKHFKADVVQVHKLVDGGNRIVMEASTGHSPECPLWSEGHSVKIGLNALACRKGKAQFVDNCLSNDDHIAFRKTYAHFSDLCPLHTPNESPKSMAVVPFGDGERIVGSLCLLFKLQRVFDTTDKTLLRNLGASLTMACVAVEASKREQDTRTARAVEMGALGELFSHALKTQSMDMLVRYCLTFLTAEQGLSFHRAALLRLADDDDGEFYKTDFAIGHIDHHAFTNEAPDLAKQRFTELLALAGDLVSTPVTEALQPVRIPADSDLGNACFSDDPTCFRIGDMDNVAAEFMQLSDTVGISEFLVVGITVHGMPFGAFLVDRPFGNALEDDDLQELKTFAVEAGHIFGASLTEQRFLGQREFALLGEVAGFVGHDLKQPISDAQHAANAVRKAVNQGKADIANENVSRLTSGLSRATDMINALRGFCDTRSDCESVNLVEVLKQTRTLVADEAKQGSVTLKFNDSVQVAPIDGYRGPLIRGFVNVLHNAVQAIKEKQETATRFSRGEINIVVEASAGQVRVTVSDNGSGMDASTRDKILERGHVSKKHGRGHGLGLGVFFRAVEKNGGILDFGGKPGEGTTVVCSFTPRT